MCDDTITKKNNTRTLLKGGREESEIRKKTRGRSSEWGEKNLEKNEREGEREEKTHAHPKWEENK